MKLLVAIALFSPTASQVDSVAHNIPAVTVSASLKHSGDYRHSPVAATSLALDGPGGEFIVEPKDLSLTVPNLLHADYGSRMTSSIYMRGLGSRMDQPAVGLYVDNVPILNKNNYDFDYFDLRRIDVLRGPQGTLYGRNTIGGVIDVHTLSPFDGQGTHIGVGYGNGNSWYARAALYRRPTERLGYSIAAHHRSTDGFFTNAYDGSNADNGRSSSLRFKLQGKFGKGWSVENSIYANLVRQGGFAYAPYDEATGRVGAIDHNDPCAYDRFGLVEGLTFRYYGEKVRLSSTTSWQFTDDDMTLDNDFSPASLFALRQSQVEHAVTQEFVARSATRRRWQWITGLLGFWRGLEAQAPITFKQDGINELILANANKGIQMIFPDETLEIRETSFPIHSDFSLPAAGLSLYHQSTWDVGRWSFVAGVRADWEYTAIRYANSAEIDYRFTATMPEFVPLPVSLEGRHGKSFFEVMPRTSVMYEFPAGNVYASVARGYKAGGYNTQIFSDILQNTMMNDIIEARIPGASLNYSEVEEVISYAPERSWNYEIGSHLTFLERRLWIDAALFYIDCRNQQLTVFPPGQGTGRMMSNAGRTRSLGAELSIRYSIEGLRLAGSWGHTNARFLVYDDGRDDYSGNYVPYAPQNTISVQADYTVDLGRAKAGRLLFGLSVQGVGRIWWNDINTLSQPFYALVNGSAGWENNRLGISLWARNLTGSTYNTFYFKSVGHSFVGRGKPLQAGVNLSLTL